MESLQSLKPAIRAAQAILKLSNNELMIDGHWGEFTYAAYKAAPTADRLRVNAVLQAFNVPNGDELSRQNEKLKALKDPEYVADKAVARAERGNVVSVANSLTSDVTNNFVPYDVMMQIISAVSKVTGVAEATLRDFLQLETGLPKNRNGIKGYKTDTVNGAGYRGLFQFDRKGDAWDAASRMIKLPEFESAWPNPYWNTLAAAAYILSNTKTIRRKGYDGPITGSIAYLMHNQGATGAYNIIFGKGKIAGVQSGPALAVARQAVLDAKGYNVA